MCPEGKFCEKGVNCEFAHHTGELDLRSKARLVNTMYSTADVLEKKLVNDAQRAEWNYWGKRVMERVEPDPPLPKDITSKETLHQLPFGYDDD